MTTVGGRAYAFGGLDAAGRSTGTILVLQGSSMRTAGRLPVAIHDAAAATSPDGALYVIGGGQIASASGIATFDPASNRTRLIGALPTPLSDLAVATIGHTTYVVGGYTGTSGPTTSTLWWAAGRVLLAGFRWGSATPLCRPCPVQ